MSITKRLTLLTNINQEISRNIENWNRIDRTSLMGTLMMYDAMLHWVWLTFVAIANSNFYNFVVHSNLIFLLIGCSLFIIVIAVLTQQVADVKVNQKRYVHHQFVMLVAYTTYITTFMLLLGPDSFVTGIYLASGMIIGLLLVADRVLVWRIFIVQCFLLICFMILPYWLGEWPSVKQHIFIHYKEQQNIQNQAIFFWRMSYLYLGFPKAIAIVYIVKRLLDQLYIRKAIIKYKAEYDELTKVRNRRSLFEFFRRNLCKNKSDNDQSVILIDLDHFKRINDIHGHLAGDKLLYQAAQLLKEALPEHAEFGRYGGEEFLAVLPNTSGKATAAIAEDLRRALSSNPITISKTEKARITASFGVGSLDVKCIEAIYEKYQQVLDDNEGILQFNLEVNDIIDTVVHQADSALYYAKSCGRNRVTVSPVVSFRELQHVTNFNKIS